MTSYSWFVLGFSGDLCASFTVHYSSAPMCPPSATTTTTTIFDFHGLSDKTKQGPAREGVSGGSFRKSALSYTAVNLHLRVTDLFLCSSWEEKETMFFFGTCLCLMSLKWTNTLLCGEHNFFKYNEMADIYLPANLRSITKEEKGFPFLTCF